MGIKNKLHQLCSEYVEDRINIVKKAMEEAQNSANEETKSSAGDKHETGRAMAQLETEKLSKQLTEILKLKQALNQINPNKESAKVMLGSIVITSNGNFYMSISAGKLIIDQTEYYAISPVSPIGSQLLNLTVGDEFSFNGKRFVIKNVV